MDIEVFQVENTTVVGVGEKSGTGESDLVITKKWAFGEIDVFNGVSCRHCLRK